MKHIKAFFGKLLIVLKWIYAQLRGKNARRLFALAVVISRSTKNQWDDELIKMAKTGLAVASYIDQSYKDLGADACEDIAQDITDNKTIFKSFKVSYDVPANTFSIGNSLINFSYNPSNGKFDIGSGIKV